MGFFQDPVDFACRELCKSLNFAIEMFQDDAVAAFNFKTLFLQQKSKPGVVLSFICGNGKLASYVGIIS